MLEGCFVVGMKLLCQDKVCLLYTSSLGWKIHTSNFSADRERVVYSSTGNLKRKDLGLINDAISQERERLLKIFAFLQQNMPGFSLSQLMDKYRMERNLRYVDAFIVREIERLRQEGRSGTAGLYLSGLYSLRRFLRGQKITFRELTYCFLTDYIHFLRMRGISENTVNMYIRNLRAVYNKAQKQGINTVSYTHLDVYKRQVSPFLNRYE